MTNYYLAFLLLLLAIGGVVVRKTYSYVPLKELKRRAEAHDPLASKLYPAASYERSLRALLWLFIVLTSASGVVVLSREAPGWISSAVVVILLWATYSWLPQSRTTGAGVWLTSLVNPVILWLLGHLHPALDRSTRLVEKRYTAGIHTGLFERDDLIDLIEQQQHQKDSRFSDEELEIAKRALSFDDHTVNNILTPKKSVKAVLAEDTVGPVLIDEMHKSKQDHVLVRESVKGDFVGTLNYKQLNLHSAGKVKDYMDATIYYIHEDDTMGEALKTFFATNHPLFVVVDNAGDFVGIVTIESILRELLGHIPGEDFDQYSSPTAVVARHKKALETQKAEYEFVDEQAEEHEDKKPKTDDTPVKTDEDLVK